MFPVARRDRPQVTVNGRIETSPGPFSEKVPGDVATRPPTETRIMVAFIHESGTTQERASGDVYKELGAGACTAEFLWTRPDGEIGVGVSPPVAGSKAMLDLKGVSREACEAKCTSIDLCGAYAHIQAGEQFCNLYSGNWREGYSAKFNSDSRYKCYERQKGKQVFIMLTW